MQSLDRNRLVELLDQLGAEQDETVLAAAREASRRVAESGYGWSDLLVPEESGAAAAPEAEESADAAPEPAAAASGERADDLKLVERLLARKGISDTLRSDLQDFKRSIAAGTFDKMDADYLRALAKRLGGA